MKLKSLIFAALLAGSYQAMAQEISLIPQPEEMKETTGKKFVFKSKMKVAADAYPGDSIEWVFENFEKEITPATGIRFKNSSPKKADICLVLNKKLGNEAYTLNITDRNITIEAARPAGFHYALTTLKQLMPAEVFSATAVKSITEWSVPQVSITDEPEFGWRGFMLDEGRHFFGKEAVKQVIDMMALYKMNRFHWHLTEDQGWRLEIKKYPLLTEKGQWRKETVVGSLNSGVYDGTPYGGYYSQEQVRDLVQYAAERYVTIIPEIELPGHALAAIACYPELSCGLEDHYETATKWGVFKQVYCPKETTFEFLEDVFDEVFELFPSEVVHIGGDECPKASWKACPHCQALIRKLGLKDEYELQSWFVTRMEKYINSKGREIIGWDEILQGGLAPNAKVMSWLGEEGGIQAARQHHEVVMAPHQKYYLDYWQADPDSEPLAMGGPTTLKTMYEYEPVPEVLTPEEARYIIGVEGCVWTEYMDSPERVEYMAWPRMCAIAETGWTQTGKDWDGFTRRLETHLGRLDRLDVGYCKAFFNPLIVFHNDTKYSKVVTMTVDAPDAEIRYTLDGSVPDASSPVYDKPFVINRQQTVTAAAFRNGKIIGEIRTKHF